MSQNILITGANGQLGNELRKHLLNIKTTTLSIQM